MKREVLIPAVVLVATALVVGWGCDRGRESTPPEQPSESVPVGAKKEAPQGPDAEAMSKIMQEIQSMPPPVEPISHEALVGFLPEPPEGWQAVGEAEGRNNRTGKFKVSLTSRQYESGDGARTVTVRVNDHARIPLFYLPWKMADLIEDDSFKKYDFKGCPAIVKFDKERRGGEIDIMVADRFIVSVHAEGVEGEGTLTQFADLIDFKGLAALDKAAITPTEEPAG